MSIRRITQTSQPQQPVGINWSNPITRGLRFAIVPSNNGGTVDLVSAQTLSFVGQPGLRSGTRGVARTFATSSGLTIDSQRDIATSAPLTLMAVAYINATGITHNLIDIANTANSDWYQQLAVNGSQQISMRTRQAAIDIADTTATVSVGVPFVAFGVTASSTNRFPVLNGVSGAVGTTSLAPTSLTRCGVGVLRRNGSDADFMNGGVYLAAVWDRALTQAEIASLSANPWQLFTPNRSLRPIALASSGAFELLSTPGVYTTTGSNATMVATRALDSSVGGYSITGANATLNLNRALDSAAGSYTLAGSNSTLVATRVLDSTPGSYAITGSNVELIYTPAGTFELTSTPGSYSITGADATLEVTSPNRELLTIPGSYILTGYDVTLEYSGEVSTRGGVSYTTLRQLQLQRLRQELKYLYEGEDDEEVKEAALELLQEEEVDVKALDSLLSLIRKQLEFVQQSTLTEKVNYQRVVEATEQVKKMVKRRKQEEAAVMLLL